MKTPHLHYTALLYVAGYSLPDPSAPLFSSSKKALSTYLLSAHAIAQRWGAGYSPSSLLIWKGYHESVQDLYPDFELVIGPRGGTKWSPC